MAMLHFGIFSVSFWLMLANFNINFFSITDLFVTVRHCAYSSAPSSHQEHAVYANVAAIRGYWRPAVFPKERPIP